MLFCEITQVFSSFSPDSTKHPSHFPLLLKNAYGLKNFNRFRNRILHIFSNRKTNLLTTAVKYTLLCRFAVHLFFSYPND